MERIGVRELRQHASVYLRRVRAGESFEVTDRGTLVAVLTPPEPAHEARDRLITEGRLIAAARPFRMPARRVARRSTAAALDEQRAEQ